MTGAAGASCDSAVVGADSKSSNATAVTVCVTGGGGGGGGGAVDVLVPVGV